MAIIISSIPFVIIHIIIFCSVSYKRRHFIINGYNTFELTKGSNNDYFFTITFVCIYIGFLITVLINTIFNIQIIAIVALDLLNMMLFANLEYLINIAIHNPKKFYTFLGYFYFTLLLYALYYYSKYDFIISSGILLTIVAFLLALIVFYFITILRELHKLKSDQNNIYLCTMITIKIIILFILVIILLLNQLQMYSETADSTFSYLVSLTLKNESNVPISILTIIILLCLITLLIKPNIKYYFRTIKKYIIHIFFRYLFILENDKSFARLFKEPLKRLTLGFLIMVLIIVPWNDFIQYMYYTTNSGKAKATYYFYEDDLESSNLLSFFVHSDRVKYNDKLLITSLFGTQGMEDAFINGGIIGISSPNGVFQNIDKIDIKFRNIYPIKEGKLLFDYVLDNDQNFIFRAKNVSNVTLRNCKIEIQSKELRTYFGKLQNEFSYEIIEPNETIILLKINALNSDILPKNKVDFSFKLNCKFIDTSNNKIKEFKSKYPKLLTICNDQIICNKKKDTYSTFNSKVDYDISLPIDSPSLIYTVPDDISDFNNRIGVRFTTKESCELEFLLKYYFKNQTYETHIWKLKNYVMLDECVN